MIKVAVVVGSLRKDSINLKFAKALEKLAQGKMTFSFVSIGDLPLFNQDLESDVPASVKKLKADIEGADAVLFVTPEYNRGLPGVLKNAIDWASRPYGSNSWGGKPAAICGASPGAIGTAVAQAQLRAMSGFLDFKMMGQPEVYFTWKEGVIADDGSVTDERTKGFLQGFVDKFAAFAAG
ncbi:MAG: NAD(P)H-dependent oxidoreductase [Alphaproteobacteria bacterium]|nr:NAD(P)H-dependent oxidoreductase [Alphaproteobacteria bacterium]MBU0860009.1 NAD(P)H-dependent oxidoreductase [Alphaproteobacteria bacterium]